MVNLRPYTDVDTPKHRNVEPRSCDTKASTWRRPFSLHAWPTGPRLDPRLGRRRALYPWSISRATRDPHRLALPRAGFDVARGCRRPYGGLDGPEVRRTVCEL